MEKLSYGFVYIWFDTKRKMYYIGSHWGNENDGYLCSSNIMRKAHTRRPKTFKRKIIKKIYTNHHDLLTEEQRWLDMIKREELGKKYYNLNQVALSPHWWLDENKRKEASERMSLAQKGKKKGPYGPKRRKAISEAKRKKFEEKRQAGLPLYSEKAYNNIANARKESTKPHTEEWKEENSKRLKKQWKDGTRSKDDLSKRMIENNPLHNKEVAEKVSKTLTGRTLPDIHKAKLIGKSRTQSQKTAAKKCSNDLKNRWADPVWKANQIQRLKEGAAKRWNQVSLS